MLRTAIEIIMDLFNRFMADVSAPSNENLLPTPSELREEAKPYE